MRCIASSDRDTARAAASQTTGISLAQVMPINTEMKWPPTRGQGWVSGLCGMANNSTEEAPTEATMIGSPAPGKVWLLTSATSKTATKAANAALNFSPRLTVVGSAIR